MDFEDLIASLAIEEQEKTTLEELDDEVALFDLNGGSSEEEEEDEEEEFSAQQEAPKEIALSPRGIAFFKSDMFSLYTEDTLVWPVQDSLDPFLSVIDASIVTECIKKGYFRREVLSTNVLAKYLFHTMCCSLDTDLRHSSCNSLIYLNTCSSLSCIKNELYLILVNLGADASSLPKDVLSYRSCVIPPPACTAPEAAQMTDTQLREVLALLFQFLSECITRHKNYTSQDADEFLRIFISIGLDPKIIDAVLDTHIAACITHTLNLYSDEEFSKTLENIVEHVLEYCGGDLPSVTYLCQAYINNMGRGKILRGVIAFHQLRTHLKLQEENFVAVVQVKDIADLLTRYFQTCPELTLTYDAYYIIKLIDLSLHLDLITPDQKSDLKIICDLAEQKFRRSLGSADDLNPTISFQYLAATLSRWNGKKPGVSKSLDVFL